MASFTEKISVVIDVTVDKATKGIKDFKSSVSEAEGFTGKLKAGVGSLGGAFRSAAANPAMMGAAIGAAGAYAVDSAVKFSNLGVEIGKFSDATGLASEDASRWVEVAGDLGVETSSLESVLGKLNKNIDPDLFAQFGIEIAKTDSGLTDANGTFLNVIDRLHRMKDPAERAAAASKLLGKGWQNVAELVGMSADDVKQRLDGVAAVKIFDDDKVKKARGMRDALDNLTDTLEEVSLQVGEQLVPALTALANAAPAAGGALAKMTQVGLDPAYGGLGKITDALNNFNAAQDYFKDDVEGSVGSLKRYKDEIDRGEDSLTKHVDASSAAALATDSVTKAAEKAEQAIRDQNDAVMASIDANFAVYDASNQYKQSLDDLATASDDATTSVDEQDQALQDAVQSALNLASQSANLAEQQARMRGETITAKEKQDLLVGALQMTAAQLEPGSPLRKSLEQYIALLAGIPASIATNVYLNPKAGVPSIKAGAHYASGGITAGGMALVGENGPELVNMPRGAQVFPAAQTAGMLGGGGGPVVINALTADPRLIVEAIKKYQRSGGVL